MIHKSCSLKSLDKITRLIANTNIDIKDGFFFSRFFDVSIINKGGFGIVLKCFDKQLNHFQAIKIIPFLINKHNPNEIISLHIHKKLREVRCLENLNHKNIIKYSQSWIETGDVLEKILLKSSNLGIFISDTNENILSDIFSSGVVLKPDSHQEYQIINIFIEMELMDMSLKTYLNLTSVNSREIDQIFKEIVEGVDYLHSRYIIHRDLKPENILINLNRDKKIVNTKIADFGLIIDRDNNDINTLDGTPLYMPLENEKITRKYDVFSLGIILFELVNKFTTEMERILTVKSLRENDLFLDDNNKYHQLIQDMIIVQPELRADISTIQVKLEIISRIVTI